MHQALGKSKGYRSTPDGQAVQYALSHVVFGRVARAFVCYVFSVCCGPTVIVSVPVS